MSAKKPGDLSPLAVLFWTVLIAVLWYFAGRGSVGKECDEFGTFRIQGHEWACGRLTNDPPPNTPEIAPRKEATRWEVRDA